MPRYRFSQGKIHREEGVYLHHDERNRGSKESVVLILVQPIPKAFTEPEPAKEKDVQNANNKETESRA